MFFCSPFLNALAFSNVLVCLWPGRTGVMACHRSVLMDANNIPIGDTELSTATDLCKSPVQNRRRHENWFHLGRYKGLIEMAFLNFDKITMRRRKYTQPASEAVI